MDNITIWFRSHSGIKQGRIEKEYFDLDSHRRLVYSKFEALDIRTLTILEAFDYSTLVKLLSDYKKCQFLGIEPCDVLTYLQFCDIVDP